MASTGRGRGRGRGLLQQVAPAPGNLQSKEQNGKGVEDLEEMIDKLSLNLDEESLHAILLQAERTIKNTTDFQHIAQFIYTKCIADREYAKCGACICDKLQELEVQGSKFRSVILSHVQKDFKEKNNLRKTDLRKYLGFFTFLCQIFGNMKLKQGHSFEPLVAPIFECLELMIGDQSTEDDELEVLSLQLQSIGKDLEASNTAKMNTLMEQIRMRIIEEGLSPRGRCTLLELVECYARSWKTMPNDITRFYCDAMAEVLAGMVV